MMTFRVTFIEGTGASGEPSERPTEYLAIDLPDGVVQDEQFVKRTEPPAMHSEDSLEEDHDFLSVGSETWDYAVAEWPRRRLHRGLTKFADSGGVRAPGRTARRTH